MWEFDEFDKEAGIDEQGSISYKQLKSEGEALFNAVGRRCLIFILCKNSIGSLIGYTGCLNNGIVPLLLDEGINYEMLLNLFNIYKPAYLWAPETSGKFGFLTTYTSYGYCLLDTGYKQYPLHDKLALLLTTSGSTGSPKLVRQSLKNVNANAHSIAKYLEIDGSERPITTLPMSYTYGLSVINSHLLIGATIIMTTKGYMQREFWTSFRELNATSIAGVPYNYEILKKLHFFKMDLPSLRYMTQAGGKLSPELQREYAEYAYTTGRRFYVMYGQTEATARMSYLPYKRAFDKYGSMGIAIPGGRFSLIDADGNAIVSPDTIGELVYHGDNVTLGYAKHGEDLAKGDEWHGVLHTGDMAKTDVDGYYYIVGRKKRFIKIFGNRVNLDEVELIIKTQFKTGCACTGEDDKMTIYITNKNIQPHIKKFTAEKTGLNAAAFNVKYIDAIPKNDAGKTIYSAL